MARRIEDLAEVAGARIYRFPTGAVRARARRQGLARRVGLAACVLGAATTLVLATGPTGSAVASRPHAPAAVTLRSGETLWDIAERYAPSSVDRRAYVDAVMALNRVDGVIVAGTRLRLPR